MRNLAAEFLVFCHQLDTEFSGFLSDEYHDGVRLLTYILSIES